MTAPESLLHEELVAIKLGACLDYVLSKMDPDARAALPMLQPYITPEFVEVRAEDRVIVAVPRWWLDDDEDQLLPNLVQH
ncbi:hypothetical protein O4160_07625 [Rhodococcus sp. IEGM 1401]|uniref:hypothetical protein n=1 Tax=unclassified Rhodococcus (in: high G+C Gram-positive bacteria) TaxID=192944 RepID=UPI0022B39A53|nr:MULTISPECIES: hypothetical protein [unclassified Rhodococcus (in: high G+C Gram-positive bacteria)]MCZ4560708.1 hypothetical protein [Rhodococcus sp. IEGM 1401]MDI9920836.1 hypothetical protein [Rhodococcus sp. IEGM 1372]MDV8033127.1 hypothetical protein [Rhodococcus sp. IEGM 1414]